MVNILIICKRKLKKVFNNLKKHNKKFFKKEKSAVRNQIRALEKRKNTNKKVNSLSFKNNLKIKNIKFS